MIDNSSSLYLGTLKITAYYYLHYNFIIQISLNYYLRFRMHFQLKLKEYFKINKIIYAQ
jgi:uncharacterized membrane protein YesL